MNRSLLTGLLFFFPLPERGTPVHISFTFSRTILQCLSKALTLPRSFLLLRQLIKTCVLFFTDWVRTESGPVLNSSSRLANSSGVISDLGLLATTAIIIDQMMNDENFEKLNNFGNKSPVPNKRPM